MVKIAVCDDEEIFCERLEAIISEYMNEKQIAYEIDTYTSGVAFTSLKAEMEKYKIVFLDINMNEQDDGIKTAKKIREFCQDTFLVFVTAFIKFTIEGYKVDAIRYILKNTINFEDSVFESLDAIFEKMNYVTKRKCFSFKEGKKDILLNRIAYIESNLHYLHFYVLESDYVRYTLADTLDNIEQELEKYDFLRIHQSYLVNLNFVSNITNYNAYLINGMVLPIPRGRFSNAKEKYLLFERSI